MNKNYIIFLLASFTLISCASKPTKKDKMVIEIESDPSPAIIKTVDNTNQHIANSVARVPTP